jgi:ammonium transporter Rh
MAVGAEAQKHTDAVDIKLEDAQKPAAGGDSPSTRKRKEVAHDNLELTHVVLLMIFEIAAIICYGLFTTYSADVGGALANHESHGTDSNDKLGSFFAAYMKSQEQNTISNYYPMFQDVHVMIFIGFGFLMTFMKRYSFSSVGFNFMLAAVTIQYAILVNGFWHCVFADSWHKIHLDIVSLITGDFAAGAVLISFGAVLGKASLEQLITMMACEIIFYSINESIGVEIFKAVDMGGSMYVHSFGAYFGLGVSMMLTDKKKVDEGASRFGSSYNSDMFAMIGTVFLWMFWPSFNGALATGNSQHRVVVNTVLSLTNSCVAAFIMSKLLRPHRRLDMVDIQNATLAGGVAVGSSADMVVGPYSALIIGFIAGSVSVIGYVYISPFMERKWGLHDTCGVHNLHGMPGVMGGIGGAISAATAKKNVYGDDLSVVFGALNDGRSVQDQAWFQAAALVCTLGISIFGGLVTGWFMRMQKGPEEYGHDGENWTVEEWEEEEDAHELEMKPIV